MPPILRAVLWRSAALLAGAIVAVSLAVSAWSAGHGDAPLIKQDPQANLADVYAFVGKKFNSSEKVLNVIVHVRPYSEPGDGVIYDRFADDALYSIHITHPTTGLTLIRYNFRFSDVNPLAPPPLKNPGTILSYGKGTGLGSIQNVGDGRQNFTQTFSVAKVANGLSTVLATGLLTPPPNLGKRTTPAYNDPTTGFAVSGAATFADLDAYTRQTIHSLTTGEAVFAGSREDGFFGDIPGIFDLLDGRIRDNNGDPGDGFGQDGNGVDGLKGFNVLAYAIQIPIASLPSFAYNAPFADLANPLPAFGTSRGVGVYATVSRKQTTVRSAAADPVSSGPWIQVSRMGNPFFNEGFVALQDKDKYNGTSPTGDAAAFAVYARRPELAVLFNWAFGTSFAASARLDLESVFIPDVLRVDTTTALVLLTGQAGFNRLGFIGGDTTADSLGRIKSSGWPNGRRLGDDVVDILLTVLASGPSYSAVSLVGDNVAANDQISHQVFPYSATPHSGAMHR